jgi:hypothetical protein
MKISEIINVLQVELEKRGDVDVALWGCYGASSDTFEVLKDEQMSKEDRMKLNVWTAIMTG